MSKRNPVQRDIATVLEGDYYRLHTTKWAKRLMRAAGTQGTSLAMLRDSQDWSCCAVAEIAVGDHIQYKDWNDFDSTDRVPVDEDLVDLGQRFSDNIAENDPLEAAGTMLAIAIRNEELRNGVPANQL